MTDFWEYFKDFWCDFFKYAIPAMLIVVAIMSACVALVYEIYKLLV